MTEFSDKELVRLTTLRDYHKQNTSAVTQRRSIGMPPEVLAKVRVIGGDTMTDAQTIAMLVSFWNGAEDE